MFPNFYNSEYGNLDRAKLDTYMSELHFTYVGEGCTRRTYLSKNKRYVLKFQIFSGCQANQREAKTWRQFFGQPNPKNGDCLYAPCRLINDNILMMRAMVAIYGGTLGCSEGRQAGLSGVDTYLIGGPKKSSLPSSPDKIDWWSVDMCQFGMMANGKYALYDYG